MELGDKIEFCLDVFDREKREMVKKTFQSKIKKLTFSACDKVAYYELEPVGKIRIAIWRDKPDNCRLSFNFIFINNYKTIS